MEIQTEIPLIDEILADYEDILGRAFVPYRNHIYRMANFCLLLEPGLDDGQRQRIFIAACFHDLGIWTNNTFDYLEPSVALAKEYLAKKGLDEWSTEIELMIDLHHKLRKIDDPAHPLVELFRRADLVDVSLGLIKFSLSAEAVRRAKREFPNSGFHKALVRLTVREFFRHPFKPLPMIRW